MYYWKALLYILVFVLAGLPAYGQDFKIEKINPDTGEVVLLDRATGNLWRVAKGQKVQGWLIAEVDQDGITISRPDERKPATVNVTRIPVDGPYSLHTVKPKQGPD